MNDTTSSSQSTSCKRFAGQIAIVTGAAQGLGLDIAKRLHADGAAVLLADTQTEAGNQAAEQMGKRAFFQETDVTDDHQIARAIRTAQQHFQAVGRLGILVNNACVYADAGFSSTRAQWWHALNVNLVSAAVFAQQAAEFMGAGAVIVNMGSTGGKFGAAERAVYPSSKAGLMQLTKNLAVTLAPRGIRCLSVSPAWTWSPSMSALSEGSLQVADRLGAIVHPLGRVGRGEEVAAAVAFACSADASWITGVDLPVDGGFTSMGPDQGLSPREWFSRMQNGGGH